MELIDKFKAWLADVEKSEAKVVDLAKRAGVYVSRPVLNGDEWAEWAAAAGVPTPLAAGDLHVTVMYSTVDVKMKPEACPLVIRTDRAVFCALGPDEESFAVAFQDWQLQDRWWAYVSNGAAPTYPTYRPHMTLSSGAKGFEIADAALADAPEYIVLGPEVAGPTKEQIALDDQDPEGVEAASEDLITVIVLEVALAAKALERTDLDPLTRTALRDVSLGRPVTTGVAKRLAAADVLKSATRPALVADVAKVAVAPVRKRVETDVVVKMTPVMVEAIKSKGWKEVVKTDDESHLIYAISNVYSIGGETVIDPEGEGFTTPAMEEFISQVLKRDASSTWEHQGAPVNVVVQGLVLSDEVQKALGIDLGMEMLVTATHFPDEAQWAKAKEGPWEQSIAGRFWHWKDE